MLTNREIRDHPHSRPIFARRSPFPYKGHAHSRTQKHTHTYKSAIERSARVKSSHVQRRARAGKSMFRPCADTLAPARTCTCTQVHIPYIQGTSARNYNGLVCKWHFDCANFCPRARRVIDFAAPAPACVFYALLSIETTHAQEHCVEEDDRVNGDGAGTWFWWRKKKKERSVDVVWFGNLPALRYTVGLRFGMRAFSRIPNIYVEFWWWMFFFFLS